MTYSFTVFVDADSCPTLTRTFILEYCGKKDIKVTFAANRQISGNMIKPDLFSMVICPNKSQAADDYIYENVQNNDIVITRDILFAQRLIEKKICTINDRGFVFTKDNIQDKLLERNFSINLAEIGLGKSSKKTYYSIKELEKFKQSFDCEVVKHITFDLFRKKTNQGC